MSSNTFSCEAPLAEPVKQQQHEEVEKEEVTKEGEEEREKEEQESRRGRNADRHQIALTATPAPRTDCRPPTSTDSSNRSNQPDHHRRPTSSTWRRSANFRFGTRASTILRLRTNHDNIRPVIAGVPPTTPSSDQPFALRIWAYRHHLHPSPTSSSTSKRFHRSGSQPTTSHRKSSDQGRSA